MSELPFFHAWERVGAKALSQLLHELSSHKYEDPESFVHQLDAIALGMEQMFCQQVDMMRQPQPDPDQTPPAREQLTVAQEFEEMGL
jgi:hypothetical protein